MTNLPDLITFAFG